MARKLMSIGKTVSNKFATPVKRSSKKSRGPVKGRKRTSVSPLRASFKVQPKRISPQQDLMVIDEGPVEVIREVEVIKEVIREVQVPLPVTPQAAPQIQPSYKGLLTTEFTKPGEKVKSSLEGFMLDQRSENTQRAYGKDLNRFVKFLLARIYTRGPEPLERNVIVAYKDWLLTDGLEHTSVDRHLATLRSVFKWLVEDGHLDRNPGENVRFLKPKRVSTTIGFTDEEVRKVLDQPNLHTRTGAMHFSILMILFFCGLRRSEVCNLRTSSLGMERGHWVFRLRGKGNRERIIPLKRAVWESLKHYFLIMSMDPKKDQFLFAPIKNNRTQKFDKAIDSSMIYYIVKKYSKMAGIANRVSPHSCRATAISNARDHHVADRAIQEFAGWSSPDMITRYDKRKTAVEDSAAHSIDYGKKSTRFPETRPTADEPNLRRNKSEIESQLHESISKSDRNENSELERNP